MNRHAGKLLTLPLALLLLVTGCDSGLDVDTDPPTLLPPQAFTMQADFFGDQGASKSNLAGSHFTTAALHVWPVSMILGAHLVIPAAITSAAFQAGAPVLEDGAWHWASTTDANNSEYNFRLSARPVGSLIAWTMHVQHVDPQSGAVVEEFNLFTAETDPSARSGSWQLFYPIDGEVQNVLNAEFSVTSASKKEITFSGPPASGGFAGDEVTFAQDGTVRTFTWVQAGENKTHLATWNAATQEGSITSPGYNGGQKACWGAQLQDVACAG